jgi:SAM-dependent methyltransferase
LISRLLAHRGRWSGLAICPGGAAEAEALCEALGERADVFPALWGHWLFRWSRAEIDPAWRLCERLLALADARQKFDVAEDVEFEPADAAALPFADRTFGAIVCQFGVIMFFPDKDKAYREAFRVLAPGGCYHLNVWDSFDFNAFVRVTHETVGRFFAENAPAFFTIPFGYR